MLLVAVAAAAEWLRAPGTLPAAVAVLAAIACAAAVWLPGANLGPPRAAPLTLVAAALAGVIVTTQRELRSIEQDWPAEREARIEAYGERVGGELGAALHAAARLTDAGVHAAGLERDAAFEVLAAAVPARGVESSVAILDADGAPWAWAGRHRLAPEAAGDSLAARSSGYYVLLETRRHSAGRTVVGSVLIWADPAVPDRERSLAERFRNATEVGLLVFPPGAAPENNPDIFDYSEPTTEGPRLLFSVQPVPPEQAEARSRITDRGGRVALWLALMALALAIALAPSAGGRALALLALLWLAVRAPTGHLLGAAPLFAATSLGSFLGGVSASPAALGLAGMMLTIAAVWLWRRPPPRSTASVAGAAAGILAAPLLLLRLSQGATPAGEGVGHWLALQGALLLLAAPFAVGAAALLCNGSASARRWRIVAGAVLALAIGFASSQLLMPGKAWPLWLALAWVPPLILVLLPAPKAASLAGIAVVLGSLAAAVLWRANIRSRMERAEQDLSRLGAVPDPRAAVLLDQLGFRLDSLRPPTNAAQLYALWRPTELARSGYPAHLALWQGDAVTPAAELRLDSLAIPVELLGALARAAREGMAAREVTAVPAVPGVHHVLAQRIAPDAALTVAIGPRSALVASDRLGRLLEPSARPETPYRLVLGSPAVTGVAAEPLDWRRNGSGLHADRTILFPGGARDVHASIPLPGLGRLVVRGLLVLVLDVALLGLVWLLAGVLLGEPTLAPGWRRLGRSFRLRLALALAGFFVVPTILFAAWSLSHFGQETERGRDLLIAQTLRDAAQSAGTLLRMPGVPLRDALRGLSERVGADLALYRGGALVAASSPALGELGVVSPLMDPPAFRALALGDELELTGPGASPALETRVGYRVVEFGVAGGLGVLATPQAAGALGTERQQFELALVLLLATIAGIAAALGGAGIVARTLSRPVADLRRAAVALGQGKPAPLPATIPPAEFEPVFGAFNRMAADVRSSQRALEEARRRTDAVLATVATGVVALDPAGRVLIANRRATDLLGTALRADDDFYSCLPSEWDQLLEIVGRYAADPAGAAEAVELTVGEHRVALQMAPLGPEVSGIVLALHDVTDLSRAERVLAWGEMARQVAHEIKNPLTPVRLGIQHLQRVYRDRREDFEPALAETSRRILSEIERLDTIARAFSRFAAPAEADSPLERVDLAAAAAEVVQLYALAGDGVVVRLHAPAPGWARARRNEVKEVLVNLLENARNAQARNIEVRVVGNELTVEDDGEGIPAELVSRIFEPHFSTTTSGSGLGLAIVKRLVEGWGGAVEVASADGRGTVVRVRAGISA